VIRIRTGQNSPTIARIVVDLADGVSLRSGDTPASGLEMDVLATTRPGAKLPYIANNGTAGESAAGTVASGQTARTDGPRPGTTPGDQGDRTAGASGTDQGGDPGSSAQTDPGANTTNPTTAKASPAKPVPAAPTEIRSLDVDTESSTAIRFQLATSAKVKPIVRYTPGTTQMLIDIPNATLALPDGVESDRSLNHPLISGVRMETIQETKAPRTRITLDTARILGYSLDIQSGSLTLELRIPRNATGVLADKLIVVDAGHGGSATGATGGGVCEKNCTLGIALKLRAELEACGARVIMTRTSDADVSLTDRSRMGNELGADLFISIHNDSNERSNSASGTSTYYHNSDPSSRALATCVQHAVMATTGLPSRGVLSDTVMYRSGFAVLRGSSMPAVLCEVAYINNQTDRRKLIDSQFQHRVAKAMCDGLRNYVEGSPKRMTPVFARPMPSQTPMPGESTDASPDAGS
jgi:N-acetylmuramoyl-L-alanine amidase